MTEPVNPQALPDPPNFEQSLLQLQYVVDQLEASTVGLAQALEYYEHGVKLLKQCHALLERAERRIDVLSGMDAQGNPVTEPFDDEQAGSLEEKAQSRAKRRSRAPKTSQEPTSAEFTEREIDEQRSLF